MTLADLIPSIEQLEDAHAIYAAPRWSPDSEVVVSPEPRDGSLPDCARGKTYLLSVAQAKRVIARRKEVRPDHAWSSEQLAGAIVYYAVYDESEPVASIESAEISLPFAV
jgi:hypothetical protein